MSHARKSFSESLRERRIAKGFSLRKFAELVGVSPTYLSQVEQGKVDQPPTIERLHRIAELLGENPDELIAQAGRMPKDLPRIIQSEPTAMPNLLRAAKGLTTDQLQKLTAHATKMKGRDDK